MGDIRTRVEPVRLETDFIQDPHAVTELLRTERPVRPVALPSGLVGWLVTSHAEAKALLSDPRLSKDVAGRPEPPGSTATDTSDGTTPMRLLSAHMLNSDPPTHTRLRRLVNKAFTARTVARLRPRIERIADDLLDGLADAERTELVDSYAFPLPITVICELLGVPGEDRDSFREWSTTLVSAASPEAVGRAAAETAAYLSALVQRKRAAPTEDLLSDLVHVSADGEALSEPELVSMAFLLLVAGHETTVNLIANGTLALLRHPDQLAALRADPGLLPGAIEEFLRYDGPINIATLRYTTEPVRVGEVEIPPDTYVLVSLLGANRDPAQYADPHRLDVTRKPGAHLAFGHGIHYCVGAPLARLEGEIAIGRLLERFPGLRLAAEPETLSWRDSSLVRSLERLPVQLG